MINKQQTSFYKAATPTYKTLRSVKPHCSSHVPYPLSTSSASSGSRVSATLPGGAQRRGRQLMHYGRRLTCLFTFQLAFSSMVCALNLSHFLLTRSTRSQQVATRSQLRAALHTCTHISMQDLVPASSITANAFTGCDATDSDDDWSETDSESISSPSQSDDPDFVPQPRPLKRRTNRRLPEPSTKCPTLTATQSPPSLASTSTKDPHGAFALPIPWPATPASDAVGPGKLDVSY